MAELNVTNIDNKEIKIIGTQDFMGKEIPVIEGGFSEGQKVVLAKTVAEIHETRLDKINELINNHRDEFEDGIDILDLMSTRELLNLAKGLGFITNNRQKNCYLLSEQGYMLLVGFMNTDKAKEIRKQLRREYFTMREIINSNEQLKANLLLQIYNGGQDGVIASKKLTELEVEEATKPLIGKIEELSPLAKKFEIFLSTEGLTDISTFSKNLGIKKLGRNNMYKYLKSNNILMNNNQPYQRFIENGMFIVKPSGSHIQNGEIVQDYKTFLTAKGVNKIMDRLTKDGFIKGEE